MLTINRVAFTVFGRPIYWYGILIAGGAMLALLSACAREKRVGVPKDTTLSLSLIMVPVALICARAYYVAFTWENYAANPLSVFDFRSGGMAIYGAVIGGAAVIFFYGRRKEMSFFQLTDLIAPSLALGQGIGRWGNFVNQEAYGVAITNPSLQFFPMAVWIDAEQNWFAATFFYESIWCILIFLALLLIEKFRKFKAVGDIFLWYGLLYCAERTIVEGLRLDSLYWGSARVSQLLSLAALVLCVVIVLVRYLRAWGLKHPQVIAALVSLAAAIGCVPALLTGMAPMWTAIPVAALLLSSIWLYANLPDEIPAITE